MIMSTDIDLEKLNAALAQHPVDEESLVKTKTTGVGLPICKNDQCFQIVPQSKNPGRPRLYCSRACKNRYYARFYYQKEVAPIDRRMLMNIDGRWPKVNRVQAKTTRAAEERLKGHAEQCLLNDNGPCAAATDDAYGRKHYCLIHAVFGEDLSEAVYAAEGKPWVRQNTTADGMWLTDWQEMTGQTDPNAAERAVGLSKEDISDFIAHGGGKATERAKGESHGWD
jgi:hypothetical protein